MCDNIQQSNDPLITKYFASNMLEVRSHQAKHCDSDFDVLLTVHLTITLANDQLDAQILNTFLIILYTYMF